MASTIRCPLLSLREWERDTRYSAKGTMGNGGMQAASEIEMRHLCEIKIATYRRYTDLSVMGVRVGVGNLFLDQSIGIDENNTFQNENITFQLTFSF